MPFVQFGAYRIISVNEMSSSICLRVAQTQAILFLKSISERGGSDIEIQYQSRSMSDPPLSDIDFKIE